MAQRRESESSSSRWLRMLSTLSDPSRMRVLRLVEQQELGVGDIARALQMPQSTASRHLKPLFELGLVVRRTEGTTSLYRLNARQLPPEVAHLLELTRSQLRDSPQLRDDDARLAVVMESRRAGQGGLFGRIGAEWDSLRKQLYGDNAGSQGMLGLLDPQWVVADIGCGTGEVAQQIAPFVGRVVAIDREQAMLDAARKRLAGVGNIELRRGDVASLPAKRGEFHAAIAMLLFHHLDDPASAVTEIARTLRSGGRLLVIDMVDHERHEYRSAMGHRHLGFSQRDIKAWARTGGLELERIRRIPPAVSARGPSLFSASFVRK